MEYIFKYKLPFKVGDTVYSFYKHLISEKVTHIKLKAYLSKDGNDSVRSGADYEFGLSDRGHDVSSKYLGSNYHLTVEDLKRYLLDETKIDYKGIHEFNIPIPFDLDTPVYVVDGSQINDRRIIRIRLYKYMNIDNAKSETRITYVTECDREELTDESYGVVWHTDKEYLVDKLLGLR